MAGGATSTVCTPGACCAGGAASARMRSGRACLAPGLALAGIACCAGLALGSWEGVWPAQHLHLQLHPGATGSTGQRLGNAVLPTCCTFTDDSHTKQYKICSEVRRPGDRRFMSAFNDAVPRWMLDHTCRSSQCTQLAMCCTCCAQVQAGSSDRSTLTSPCAARPAALVGFRGTGYRAW